MIRLMKKKDLNLLVEHPKIGVDNSGYMCANEDIEEIKQLKENLLKGLVEVFSDVIYDNHVD